jgi:hypothetical protein
MTCIISKRLYDAVVNVGVSKDGKIKIRDANAQAALLTGYAEGELCGMDLHALFTSDAALALKEEASFSAETPDLSELFRRLPRMAIATSAKRQVPVEVKVFSLPPAAGYAASYELILRDRSLNHLLAEHMWRHTGRYIDGSTGLYTGPMAEDCVETVCRYANEHPETPVTLGLAAACLTALPEGAGLKDGDLDNVASAVSTEVRRFIRAEDVVLYFSPEMLERCGAGEVNGVLSGYKGVFCVALIGCDVVQAHRCFERMRRGVRRSALVRNICYPLHGKMSVTVGCAPAGKDGGFDRGKMLSYTAEALRSAWQFGGNRVAIHADGDVLLRYASLDDDKDKRDDESRDPMFAMPAKRPGVRLPFFSRFSGRT